MSLRPCPSCPSLHVEGGFVLPDDCAEGRCIFHKDYCPLSAEDLGAADMPPDRYGEKVNEFAFRYNNGGPLRGR